MAQKLVTHHPHFHSPFTRKIKGTDTHNCSQNKCTQSVDTGNKHHEWIQTPSLNPGGPFCHYWLLCERICRNAASSKCCPVAGTENPLPAWCVLLAITAHWVTGQWKMPDKHHTGNELPSSSTLFLFGCLSGLRIALDIGAAYFKWHHESQKVKQNIHGWQWRIGCWVD